MNNKKGEIRRLVFIMKVPPRFIEISFITGIIKKSVSTEKRKLNLPLLKRNLERGNTQLKLSYCKNHWNSTIIHQLAKKESTATMNGPTSSCQFAYRDKSGEY